MQFTSGAVVFCGTMLIALIEATFANGQSNPYYNQNSQAVADYAATYLYSSEVQMLRTAYQPGCIDSNSAPQRSAGNGALRRCILDHRR
jgi:hypothetical protein